MEKRFVCVVPVAIPTLLYRAMASSGIPGAGENTESPQASGAKYGYKVSRA